MKKPHGGFTLIELLITIAIVGVLAALASPSFSTMIKNNRLVTNINDLRSDLGLARSEAAKRGVRVTLCASSSPYTSCLTTGTSWTSGRIVFVDNDGDGVLDNGEEVLRVIPALTNGSSLTASTISTFIQYRPNGISSSAADFKLCDDRTGSFGRKISINVTGRPYLQSSGVTCP